MEPDEGAEPSLGWPEGRSGCVPLVRDMCHGDDRELDEADDEDGGDTEPNGDETDHSFIPEEYASTVFADTDGAFDGGGKRIARDMLAMARARHMIRQAGG